MRSTSGSTHASVCSKKATKFAVVRRGADQVNAAPRGLERPKDVAFAATAVIDLRLSALSRSHRRVDELRASETLGRLRPHLVKAEQSPTLPSGGPTERALLVPPFGRELWIHPLAEPRLLLAPAQALGQEHFVEAAAFHGDALGLCQICPQPIERPGVKRQAEGLRAAERGRANRADLLVRIRRRVRRRAPTTRCVLQPLQPLQPARLKAMQP